MKNNIRASCPRSNTAPKTWGLCYEARRPYTGYLLDVMSGALPGPVVRLPRFPGPQKNLKNESSTLNIQTDFVKRKAHCQLESARLKGVYTELANKRLQFLQLRSILTDSKGKLPDENKGLLEVFTNKIYGAMRDTLPTNLDAAFSTCIKEWETSANRAATKAAGNQTAAARARATPPTATSAEKGSSSASSTPARISGSSHSAFLRHRVRRRLRAWKEAGASRTVLS